MVRSFVRRGVAGSEGEERGGSAHRDQHRQFAAEADTLLPRLLQPVGITVKAGRDPMTMPDTAALLEDAADRIADFSRADLQIMLRRAALRLRNAGRLPSTMMWRRQLEICAANSC